MKRIYLFIFTMLSFAFVNAATTTVTNGPGLTFSPANITINVGDTVDFSIAANHNVLEVSMATYNMNGTTSNGGFSLPLGGGIVTGLSAGTYYYVCTPHASSGMKGTITVNAAPPAGCDLLITGAFDGPLSGGVPKMIELYVVNNIADLSQYGVSSVTNGSGTTGSPEFTFPAVTATAGDYIYIATDSVSVFSYFGFNPDYTNGFMSVNGDDAIELFAGGVVVDVFGEVDCDPNAGGTTCPEWEYLDGWAYRADGNSCATTFDFNNWTFSGADATDGETTNAAATSVFPNGTYQLIAVPVLDTIVTFTTITGSTVESTGTFTLNLRLNQVTNTNVTVDVALSSGTAANLGNTFPETVTFMAGSTTATLDVAVLDDAVIEPNETYEFTLQNSGVLVIGTNNTFTLTVQDDDTPLTQNTIASVTTVDATGTPDSLGVACEVSGVVMGINYADAPDVSFYIHDGTGGMGVYNPANTVGYTVSEGDQVTVKGEVGFFNGLTQMVNLISVTTSGMATLPAVTTATAPLGESTEGELVKLANVTVVDQNDWNTGMGAGFNVEVTDGTNTFSVRIDKSTDLYSMVIPGCVLDVTGIGTQFDNSSPYDEGYQLLPRYMADITVIDTCAFVAPTATSIADATEVDSDGEPLMLGSDVTLKGIITSPDFRENQNAGTEFTFSDGTGGIWAYSSDSTLSFDPIIGDSVVVSGNIGAASGVTRLFIDVVTSLGAATPFTPTVVSTSLDESHEAELITINGLKLNGAWNSSGGSYNVSATANGITYDIRVDADRAELFQVPLTSTQTFNLTGVGSQFDPSSPRTDGYQIMPRISSDIELTTSISDLSLNNFTVSPVPASDILNIRFDYTANEEANIQLVNVIGKVVATKNVNLNNGVNTNSISVANLTSGLYILQIQTSNGVSNTNVVVK